MWPKISRTVIRWGLRHEIDSRLHHFHDASQLLNYFESEKLFYLPPPQQKLIFWFKDNLGRISTTENCSFFPFLYVIIRWLSQYLRTRTFHRNKRAGRFHLAPLRCSLLQRRIYLTVDSLQSKQWSKRYSLKTFAS